MRPDLRLPVLGAAAWAGGLLAAVGGDLISTGGGRVVAAWLGAAVAVASAALFRRVLRPGRITVLAAVAVLLAVGTIALLRQEQAARNPVAALAGERAMVTVEGTLASDPRVVDGGQVLARLTVRAVEGRGRAWRLRTSVVVLGSPAWRHLELGARVRTQGRLTGADDPQVAALVIARGEPETVTAPDVWWAGAAAVRAALRACVAHRPADQAALVPALVSGDDAGVSDQLADDFRTTGLTHLLAVSGTNLTLVLGFLLTLARWAGVRGRWLVVVGAAGVVGFVLLARTEPSVVRAAAMGTVGLLAMSSNGRGRALRGLGAAVVGLLLLDPALAVSVGFALSVLATAGILLLGPAWRDALARWLPRWLAEAVAVSTTAQLACTPLVAAISGQVSLVAVAANVLVEPLVGPATVLGLAGGLLALVWLPLGQVAGTLASWCVGWIAAVAQAGARLPAADIAWSAEVVPLLVLTALTCWVALVGPRLVASRWSGASCAALLAIVVVVRPPTPGWPPPGWVLVACDVGQGDALALNAGPGAAVVVDAGPDPAPVDRCLDDLDINRVPLLVLSHFHADHVDGLDGVLAGREVAAIETTRLADPAAAAREVAATASTAGASVGPAAYGSTRSFGGLTLQVLWPTPDRPTAGGDGSVEGSAANDASVVLLVEAAGLRLLLTGDVEPPAQAALARTVPGLDIDVLKVPHHGSRHQDADWLASLTPTLAIASAGAGNDYGHPAPETVRLLEDAGARVLRTDRDGTVAVVASPEGAEVVTR